MKNELLAKIERSIANKVRGKNASQAEKLVGYRLRALGFLCVAPIATPVKLIPCGPGKPPRRVYTAKVAGDFYALTNCGRGVLVEVKLRDGASLAHSDLEPHQRERLTAWSAAGGLSLLAWVNPAQVDGLAIIPWHFVRETLSAPRGSISWAPAYLHRLIPTR